MRWWKLSSLLALAVALGVSGCGSSSSSGVALSVSPTSASVITNRTQPFTASVTGSSNTTVNWIVTCATGVTAGTCGSVNPTSTTGSNPTTYSAPATLPTTTSNGTTTIAPTATITGTSQADTSKTASAAVTIITGISINITPSTATLGTGEHFSFSASVNNPGCILSSNPTCQNVTWSLPTTTSTFNPGTITVPDPNNPDTAKYVAPGTVPSPSAITITATSVADTSVTATATATIVTATTPTVTSVSPSTTALGGLFQDIYISGANFISTNNVYINTAQLDPTDVTEVSNTVIRARIPDVLLAVPPASNILQVGVSEQVGAIQTCPNSDPSPCQITIRGVRPGVVGPSPNSISQQSSSAALSFNVDGGFFGTSANPAVTAAYDGQLRGVQVNPSGGAATSTRQLSIAIGGSANPNDLSQAGLHQVAVKSATDPAKFAVTNLAVQTNYNTTSITPVAPNRIPVGSVPASSAPSDVAINPATGMAIVVNTGSNDLSLIDLTASAPAVVANICTAAVGLPAPTSTSPCPASGPASVSVDSVRNIALVANSTSKTIAVVDLSARAVTSMIQLPPETPGASGNPGMPGTPGAVGINPVTGRALVAMQSKNYGVLLDLTVNPPAVVGVVSISTGPKTHVAVEPHLNWAVATPGGAGSIAVVDLNEQSSIPIATLSRTTNVVQVTVQTSGAPLTVHLNSAVQISGASDDSFNGIYLVTALGPASTQFSYTQTGAPLSDGTTTGGTVNYSQPIPVPSLAPSVQGVGINTETQQAVMVDPSTGGVVSFYSLIDQTPSSLTLTTNNAAEPGTIAAAFNPLTNIVVAVNFFTGMLSVIDPTTPRRLNDGNLYDLNTNTPCAKGCGPVAVAVDPGTNTAVVVNQTDNSVSVLNLGPIRPFSITETSCAVQGKPCPGPNIYVTDSSLSSAPAPVAATLTVTGKGLTCANGTTTLTVRLDGDALQTFCSGNGDRQLTAIALPSLLLSAHRYALDVADTNGNVTNAEDFTVEQSIDVSSTTCPIPQPSGVAVDPTLGDAGTAAVSLFGCNQVALIDMATSTARTVNVGSNPVGVAVLPRLHFAVVANNGSANASIVDEAHGNTTPQSPVATGTSPTGAAADDETGEVAIANNVSNTVSVVNAQTGAVHSITTGSGPVAVGFNYANHQVAVADFGSSNVGTADGSGSGTTAFPSTINAPTSVVYDPVPTDCGSSASSSTPNTVGCFLANSSTDDLVYIIDPVAGIQNSFKVGVNPTAIAYNFLTSTLVTTNTSSRTVTVADFLASRVRAVLPLPPIAPANSNFATNLGIAGVPLYALDLHPFLNIAVIADTANGAVLFIPLPR